MWKGFFIDRKVHDALTNLFSGSEPAKEIVSAVRHRDPDLKLSEIRESLARVRVVFDFPAPLDAPGPKPALKLTPIGMTPAPGMTPASDAKHVEESEKSLSVKKLLEMHRLSAGAILEASYLGQRQTAELLADGRVRYAGTVYDSLSGAGSAMRIAVKQPEEPGTWSPNNDGWSFWRVQDEKTGRLVALKEIRRRAAQEL